MQSNILGIFPTIECKFNWLNKTTFVLHLSTFSVSLSYSLELQHMEVLLKSLLHIQTA